MISLMVFRIKPREPESRLGLAVGGLFAAVGNKYIVEGIVPPNTTQNTLIDTIHNVTFGAILIIVIMTIYITTLQHKKQKSKARHKEFLDDSRVIYSF